MGEAILKFNQITKIFPGVKALDNVSIEFKKGEVHGIVGENGAGKSTLIKVLTGAYEPTSGSIELEGKEYNSFQPKESMDLGISTIYQEFNLVPFLTVAENVFFGNEVKKGVFIDKNYMNKKTMEMAKNMGIEINPRAQVKDIGIAYKQIVEIMKAVSRETKILIMDEPSAPLTNREIDSMFRIIRRLREDGVTVIYISHRLEEIFEICDRVSVMRDGNYIVTKDVKDVTRKELISYMVGRDLGESFISGAGPTKDIVLSVKNLRTSKLKDVSFQLYKSEILGFGGLVGAGRTEIARAVFGADAVQGGEIIRNGKTIRIHSPADAIANGIGLLPEDRKGQGLILGMQVRENTVYGILKKLTRGVFIDTVRETKICEELKKDLKIKTPTIKQITKFLSGGNQQKVVLAKWLATECDILMFDEPTRGIDVGAKQEIYQLMHELTKQGKSIIMISSEMPELIGMADRIIVMHEGQIKGELEKSEYSQEVILEMASS